MGVDIAIQPTGVYFSTPCPGCEAQLLIGPIAYGDKPVKIECTCGFAGEYVAYGGMTMTLYCKWCNKQ
jgi:hypothetical protein